MAGKSQQLGESVVIRSLRRFRDAYFPNRARVVRNDLMPVLDTEEETQPGFLDILPVRQILIHGNVFRLFNCPKMYCPLSVSVCALLIQVSGWN